MEDELFRFARIVQSTPALRGALVDRDLAVEARQALVTQLLEGKVLPGTLDLVRYVVAGGRARDIVGHARTGWSSRRPRPAAGASPGSGRPAPMEEAQQAELCRVAGRSLAGAPVELQVVIDQSLLSGAVIQIGDLQVDASGPRQDRRLARAPHAGRLGRQQDSTPARMPTSGTTTQTEGAG